MSVCFGIRMLFICGCIANKMACLMLFVSLMWQFFSLIISYKMLIEKVFEGEWGFLCVLMMTILRDTDEYFTSRFRYLSLLFVSGFLWSLSTSRALIRMG